MKDAPLPNGISSGILAYFHRTLPLAAKSFLPPQNPRPRPRPGTSRPASRDTSRGQSCSAEPSGLRLSARSATPNSA